MPRQPVGSPLHAEPARRRRRPFAPPPSVSHPSLLVGRSDVAFRETLYLMVLAFSRLITCREAFGRALGLTGSQFAVLFGVAYRQGREGVSIRGLAEHIQLASTHVTTEVGRLVRKGLLMKTTNQRDRRGVLIRLSQAGEAAVRNVAPFLRHVNDRLFEGVSRRDLAALDRFLRVFARNGEEAVARLRRHQVGRGRNRPRSYTKRPAPARGPSAGV